MSRTAITLVVAIAAAGCSANGEPAAGDGRRRTLSVSVASYDLAVDGPGRFIVGLATGDNLFVSGGAVDLRFSFLGETKAEGEPEQRGEATAQFLPLPGEESPPEGRPTAGSAAMGRGVYQAEGISFDTPGIWEVEVTAEIQDRGRLVGTGAFQVLPETLVPAPGDPAPRTENLTLDSRDAPKEAIDSRALTGEVPDPELHDSTVAEAIHKGVPVLLVISTPTYGVSRFCGPVTDMVQRFATEYEDRAEFIHIEVWRDFQGSVVNQAAAEWILRKGDLQEPWVFLVGADGRVVERWDNVADEREIGSLLRELPPIQG